uniref:Transporter n=1 Tax=Syphacia muris TaxID=451379 RepID=A0A158R4M9_9BILA
MNDNGDAGKAAEDASLQRSQWSGKFDFLMSLIAYAIGLGNIWRFPYLCFKNGGGAFLVVYGIFFLLAALPIFVMEVTIGQYLQRGSMDIWRMCPIFTGVGIGNVVISFMCISYFCVITSWSIFYLINSFAVTFPWETCNNWNNKSTCLTGSENASVVAEVMRRLNGTARVETSVEQYWERRVLMQSESISEFGGIQWELLALMLFSWILVYFALWKGITKARKFVYFCAIFPYFLLAILLIRGLTLPGAYEGIKFYITPNITVLTDATVWKDAGTQVFYSYGLGFGTLIALGSHNKFHHNCFRDAFLMCFINGSTSILAGFAVFSVLGYMSYKTLKPIDQIVKGGVGLTFQAYPEVATVLPGKQFWGVLFFLMITIIGLDSQVCMLEGLFTALEDIYPSILRKHKKLSLLLICILFFLIGIPMVSHAGSYWLTLFDGYGASGIALLFVVIFEIIGLTWGFGANNIRQAIYVMINLKLSVMWNFIWQYSAPTLLLIFCVWQYTPEKTMDGQEYPYWAQLFGFFLALCSIGAIPSYAIYYMWTAKGSLKTVIKIKIKPSSTQNTVNSFKVLNSNHLLK